MNSVGVLIREKVLLLRKGLSRKEVESLSQEVSGRFLKQLEQEALHPSRWSEMRIGMYRALSFEANLSPIAEKLAQLGAEIYYPRVVKKELEFVKFVEEKGTQFWRKGSFGIEEPAPEFVATQPDQLDLFFIPGVAFGTSGERIGMGAGYYDRYLPKAPRALRVAVTFDFQLLDRLDQSEWDQPVHWIFTEKRNVCLPFARSWLEARKNFRK